jgi:hypothetical protein
MAAPGDKSSLTRVYAGHCGREGTLLLKQRKKCPGASNQTSSFLSLCLLESSSDFDPDCGQGGSKLCTKSHFLESGLHPKITHNAHVSLLLPVTPHQMCVSCVSAQ